MKLFQRIVQLAILIGLSCAVQAVYACSASIPESTPIADFVDNGNATVTHSRTGLMWKRCAEGQTWSGSTCNGSASSATWANALKSAVGDSTAGFGDWRLPNLKELESIVEDKCGSPSINSSVFPNTPDWNFWSASANARNSSYAWLVFFRYGNASSEDKNFDNHVRLVRAGQSFTSFDTLDTLELSVAKTGTGTISGGTINCGGFCSGKVGRGSAVTLTATPASNLLAWGGACSGSVATCTVTMDAAKYVTASFIDTALVSDLPAALTFATQNIGTTSAVQSVPLSNSGTAAMAISRIAATGDFGLTHNCGTGLGTGGFCNLRLTFSPTASGTRSGNLTLNSNAPGSPHSIALSGIGQGGTSVVSATSMGFESLGVGSSSSAQTVTLRNTGVAALNIASIAVTGDFAHTTTCGSTLPTGNNCGISVRFLPTALGARSGNLVITSDAVNSPISVALTGTGVASPAVSLSKIALGFISSNLDPSASSLVQTFTLTNSGTMLLHLGSITASDGFSVDHNCGGGLGIGGNCTVTVMFVSGGTSHATGSILIASDAPGSPHKVTLLAMSTSAAADTVFNWAERTYPDFFFPANGASQITTGFRFRVYNGGGFLAVNDSSAPNLYYLGPLSGNIALDLGPVAMWLTLSSP